MHACPPSVLSTIMLTQPCLHSQRHLRDMSSIPDDSNLGVKIGIPITLGIIIGLWVFLCIRQRRQAQRRRDLETPDPLPIIPPWEVQPSDSEATALFLSSLSQQNGSAREREREVAERQGNILRSSVVVDRSSVVVEPPSSQGNLGDVAVLREQLNAVMHRVHILETGGQSHDHVHEHPPPIYSSAPHSPQSA
ncbi:hypothetical protein PM082_011345 [Marasmius tenuissimus]|nr:hypothetical protein PM082_011345 [Marasmius tenuissimus]